MADLVGQQLGNYRLLRVLGRGAFAVVYLGEHQYLERPAAIKVLHVQIEPAKQEAFRHEARTIAQLHHPHLIGVHDFGFEGQTPYLVMEYMPNGTLRSQYPKGTRLSFEQIAVYVKQIASALDYAHEQQVIHRDVKPENILLGVKDEVVLSDFGIAMAQQTLLATLSMHNPAGTPIYMAPEQIQNQPCAASDQYAVGVMVYEWLCGELPFHGSLFEVFNQHLHKPPPSLRARLPQLPPTVEDAVFKALAKDPGQRFARVTDFATVLTEAFFATQPPSLRDRSQDQAALPPSRPVPSPNEPGDLDYATQRIEHEQVPVPSVSPQSASHNQTIPKPAKFSHAQANRERLLRRVRSFWITGVLEQSLHRTALLTLGLQEQPDAVANPWRLVIQESERAGTPLPAGTRITEVYYEAHGELLILGSPGAGKTTLLLELARDLLNRAEQETARPIPVVFNLSSWTRKQSSLAAWLIEELETKYQVPRKVGSDWINADQILPLLDGLDEVDATSRAACMQAINEYHQAHPLVPLVVCCRVNEYTALTNRLALFRAVAIQPLTTEQVNEYLVRIDEQVASLRVAFQNDPVLQKLVTTPLMLSILVMTYKGSSLEEIEGDASAEVRRRQIFATYTQRMLRRRSANSRYGPQQTLHWLSFLARQMKRQSQSVFFLERMQPDWVPKNRRQQIFSALIAGLVSILLFGLSAVLIFGLTGVFFGSQYQSHMIRVSGISSSLSSQSRICIMDGNNPDKQVCGPWEESYGRSCTLLDGNSEICAWQESPSRACLSEDNNPDSEVCISREDGPGQGVCLFESNNPDSQVCISQDGSRFLFLSRGTIPSGIAIPMSTGTVQGGVTSALLFGFLSILIGGMTSIRKRSIHPVEVVKWQWTGRRRRLLMGLLIGLGLGLLIGELLGLLSWIIDALLYTQGRSLDFTEAITGYLHYYPIPMQGFLGLRDALLFGGTGLLLGGVTSRMSHELMDEHIHTTPNEGIHRSVRYAVVSGLIILLVAGGSIGLSTGQPTEGLFFGLVAGIVTGLSNGGLACIRHLLLRVRLWYARVVPWNYPSFLDYAVERILLRKVGGGYIFMHRLLLEYFADVETGATP